MKGYKHKYKVIKQKLKDFYLWGLLHVFALGNLILVFLTLALKVSKAYALTYPLLYSICFDLFLSFFFVFFCVRFYYGDVNQRIKLFFVVVGVLIFTTLGGIFFLGYIIVFTDYFTNEVVFSFGDLVFYKYFWEDDYMLSEGLKILETKGGSDLFNDSEFKEIVKKSNNNLEFLRINLEEAIEQKKNSFTYKVFYLFPFK